MPNPLRIHSGKLVAVGLAGSLALLGRAPSLSPDALADIARDYSFTATALASSGDASSRRVREVHPQFSHIANWISAVGAAVALSDLDADGLPNDYCLVDPRNDSVTVGPVPTRLTPPYVPFALPTPRESAIAPMGCLPADVNADGLMDLVVYYWGRTPQVWQATTARPSPRSFQPVELVSGEQVAWYTNAALFADVDGDGQGDLMFGNYFADDAGVLDVTGQGAAQMQHSMSRAFNAGDNRLLLNSSDSTGDVHFRDASEALSEPMRNGWTLAMGAADLDGDLLPELYIANDFGPDRLLHNLSSPGAPEFALVHGQRGFADIRSATLGRDSFKGMSVDFADLNRDGEFDLYVSNIAEEYALLESHMLFLHQGDGRAWSRQQAPFKNASGRLGLARSAWSWGAKLGDFNNDGRLEAIQTTGFVRGEVDRWPELQELAMGNDELLRHPWFWPSFEDDVDISGDAHDRFFASDGSGRYVDIAPTIGMGYASVSRGVATADVDGDGDLDFAIARQWEGSTLFINELESPQCALVLDLRLRTANGRTRAAIGAVARTTGADGAPQVGYVDGGNGHSGVRSTQVHFGLGGEAFAETSGEISKTCARHMRSIEVQWRDAGGAHRTVLALRPGTHRIVLDGLRVAKATIPLVNGARTHGH